MVLRGAGRQLLPVRTESPDESPPSGGPPGFLLGGHGAGVQALRVGTANRGPPQALRDANFSCTITFRRIPRVPGMLHRAEQSRLVVPRVRADPCTFYIIGQFFRRQRWGLFVAVVQEAVLRHALRQLWSLRHAVCVTSGRHAFSKPGSSSEYGTMLSGASSAWNTSPLPAAIATYQRLSTVYPSYGDCENAVEWLL